VASDDENALGTVAALVQQDLDA
ncbi:MAG: hypothetical protein QOE04_5645, partial [Mycobacterium sp.]|nr:hypothetical protein [Mycobacterium sp.]